MSELQNIEYKTSRRDKYLKWICGFTSIIKSLTKTLQAICIRINL